MHDRNPSLLEHCFYLLLLQTPRSEQLPRTLCIPNLLPWSSFRSFCPALWAKLNVHLFGGRLQLTSTLYLLAMMAVRTKPGPLFACLFMTAFPEHVMDPSFSAMSALLVERILSWSTFAAP